MKNETRKLNKRMLERLIIIHNAIKSGSYPNAKELQRIYCDTTGYASVGIATIWRDIECLRVQFKAPLEYSEAKEGYYYANENFDLQINRISATDVFYLAAAKNLLGRFVGSPIYDEISSVIDFLADTQAHNESGMLNRIAVPPAPRSAVPAGTWNTVLDALKSNHVIEFDYNGRWNTETTHRKVRPYQVLLEDGAFYLYGYSCERKDVRLFGLTRMKNVRESAETFCLPRDYDFAARCGGGKFGLFASGKSEKFVIDFYGDSRQYVRERIWADDQKIEDDEKRGRTRISFSSSQWYSILDWVLGRGGNAVPVKPAWFVGEWQKNVRAMAERAGLLGGA